MADMYGNTYDPKFLPGQLGHFPLALSARTNQYNALYHGMPYQQNEFRYGNYSNEPSSQIAHFPKDPYSTESGHRGYHQEHPIGSIGLMPYPQTMHFHQLGNRDPVAFAGRTLPSYSQGQVQDTLPQYDRLPDRRIEEIRGTAERFVDSCCPLLGLRPYCLPPIKRYRHPDKSNKKLVKSVEGETRVLGSFERYFVEKNVPVFMLCYYPLSGFLQVYKSEHLLDKNVRTVLGQNSKHQVMLLLSTKFAVTVMLISSIGGNAQFDHLRRRVLRSVTQMNEISSTVASWLKLLGVRSEVRQVIAYPNLKRSVMAKVRKDKQVQHTLGSLCTLHVDELSPPFGEEWSDPQKQLFHFWMLQNVVCHDSTLSPADLHLVVGALLSPKLSKAEFVQEEKMIMPISETIQYTDAVESKSTGVGQMELTVDGVTKPFDEFMDQYVACYYPNVETRTYRVPPIHFNIQSLKRSSEYINTIKGEAKLKGLSAGPGDKESKSLEHHLSAHQSRMAGSGENINSDFRRETIQFESALSSAGKNSKGDLAMSVFAQCEPSSNNLQKSDHCTEGKMSLQDSIDQDSTSSRNSTDKHVKTLGIYFKENPNSSISLLCNDTPTLSDSQICENINLQALQDVEVLAKVMDKDIRKDEGENRVISALEMLGHRSNMGGHLVDPMFIICGFQYNNYLNKLREEMFPKEETSRPVSAFGQTMRAEHDCLIFHQKFGAIIVCIKAIGDNFDEWHATEDQKIASTKTVLEKALKQLKREEDMIKHVTSDLSFNLKCHKLIALPNMSRASVKAALWTDLKLKETIREALGHEADLFLCSDELPVKHTFLWDGVKADVVENRLITWWNKVKTFFESSGDNKIAISEYKQLIGRYCGLFSTIEVWSPTNPRMEVRSPSEAIKTCADRFCKFVLLPCQLRALCSSERQVYLYGPPGSGKTLVLTLKAKQWMLAGRTVVLVNSRCGSSLGYPYAYSIYNRLQKMMIESKIPLRQLYMISIDSLNFNIGELKSIKQSDCVVMDEVTASSRDIIISLCYRQISSIWCAGLYVEDIPKTDPVFSTYRMEKILRCPPAVQSVLKHTEEAVRINKPYEKVYQSSITEQEHCFVLNNDQFNNYIDKITKSHFAYFSQLQKGKKRYVKSETSNFSRVQPVPWAKRLFDDTYSHRDTVEVKYDPESVNERLRQKFDQQSLSERLMQKYDQESLSERLMQKYGCRDYVTAFSASRNTTAQHVAVHHEVKPVLEGDQKYDQESLQKRLEEKYGRRDYVTAFSPSRNKTVQHVTVHQGVKPVLERDQMYDQESLQKRLQEKYGCGPQTKSEKFSESYNRKPVCNTVYKILSDSEALNTRLKENYNGRFFNKLLDAYQRETIYRLRRATNILFVKNKCNVDEDDSQEYRNRDVDMLTSRLQKYARKTQPTPKRELIFDEFHDCTSHTAISLPSDGPQPKIIDHSRHSKTGIPIDCQECAHELAEFLNTMIRPDSKSIFFKGNQNFKETKISGRGSPESGNILLSNALSVYKKLPKSSFLNRYGVFENRALSWSDVVIVSREMPKASKLLTILRNKKIPLEVCLREKAYRIEDCRENKLFVTSCKEITGIERPVIIFLPSDKRVDSQQPPERDNNIDLRLANCINYFSEEDKVSLYYAASRSLAFLVLILP